MDKTVTATSKKTESKKCGPTYGYNESFAKCIDYFNGDELAAKVFLDKYALRDNSQNLLEQTPADMHLRIAREFARIEKDKFDDPLTEGEIFDYLNNFSKIIPQGSPMYGIGNEQQTISLSNCFVIHSPIDSYGGIHRTDEQLSQISKRRGGVGLDISHLRPNGAITKNAARTSTGIIPFMERFSNSIREVGQGGRRGALMITISVHHPEVLEFAQIKNDMSKVTGANISIRLSDEFLKAVQAGGKYEQCWPVDARENGKEPTVSRMVDAKELWMKIIESAHACLLGSTEIMVAVEGERRVMDMFDVFHLIRNDTDKTVLTPSLNLTSNKIEWQPIIDAQEYPLTKTMRSVKLRHGKSVVLTEDHIVYRMSERGDIEHVESKYIKKGDKISCAKHNGYMSKVKNDKINLVNYLSYFESSGNYCVGDEVEELLSNPLVDDLLGYYDSNKTSRALNCKIQGYLTVRDLLKIQRCSEIKISFKGLKLSPARQPDLHLDMNFAITIDLAFLMGLWMAEGSIHRNGLKLHIHTNEYAQYQAFFDNVCKQFKCNHYKEVHGLYTCVYINSSFLSKLFIALGFKSVKDSFKDIPDFIFDLSKEICGSFITGFVCGDATTPGEKGSICIGQSNFRLLNKLQALLREYGVLTSIKKKRNAGHKIINNKLCNTKDQYSLRILAQSVDVFCELLIHCESLKIDKIKTCSSSTIETIGIPYEANSDLFDRVFRKNRRQYVSSSTVNKYKQLYNDSKIHSYMESDINFETVISNDEYETTDQFVYDITVDNNHTFMLLNGLIVSNSAEPGLLFWDNIIRESPADCYVKQGFKTISTNPCAELPLCTLDSCRLLLLNLFSYVEHPFTNDAEFDFYEFYYDVQVAQRLMDDLVDLELEKIDSIITKIANDPEPEDIRRVEIETWEGIRKKCIDGRRTGTGITGLGDTLAAIGVKYGSKESIEITEKIYKTLKFGAYRASVNMAKEIGPFPVWNTEQEKDCPFLNRFEDEVLELTPSKQVLSGKSLLKEMRKYGRRNISLLTTAPAGCLDENVVIETDRGCVSLKDLFDFNGVNIDDLRDKHDLWFDCEEDICVYDVYGNKNKINKLYWKGNSSGYEFTFDTGYNIKTSQSHKFLVLIDDNTAEWKEAKDIKINEKIVKIIKEQQHLLNYINN